MLRMLSGYAVALAISSGFIVWHKHVPNYAQEFFAGLLVIFLFTIVPWLVCVLVANSYSIRNPIYYMAWAIAPVVVIAAFSRNGVFILFGPTPVGTIALISGLAYWAIAGRKAGAAPTRAPPSTVPICLSREGR